MSNKERKTKPDEDRKTIIRYTKSGRKYFWNPNRYAERLEEARLERLAKGDTTPNSQSEKEEARRNAILLHSDTDEHYLRYVEKKKAIRFKYGRWLTMEREEWLRYFTEILHLLQTDKDYHHFRTVTCQTIMEKEADEIWERKKIKDSEYNGSMDEYHI